MNIRLLKRAYLLLHRHMKSIIFYLFFWQLLVQKSVTSALQKMQTPVSPHKLSKIVHLRVAHLVQLTAAPPWEHIVARMVTSRQGFSEVALTVLAS